MTFAMPLALLLVPLLALLVARRWPPRPASPALVVADLAPLATAARRTWRVRLRWLPDALRTIAIVLVIFALARPRQGLTVTTIPEEGIDIVVCVDVSSSMLSGIGGDRQTRLSAARTVVGEFVDSLHSDRIGLVIFQARALTLSPLTSDHAAIQTRVARLEPGLVPDGTAIGLGLSEAVGLLQDSVAKSRVIVLLTDGENNAGEVEPLQAARVAQALGMRVYTVGFTAGGASVDREVLTTMAESTGGRSYDARTRTELESAYEEIGSLERSHLSEERFTSFREFAPWLAAVGLVLLVIEGALRATWLRRHP